jgi:hypothetical protein
MAGMAKCDWQSKVVSLALIIAMVVVILPLGVIAALASTSTAGTSYSAGSADVVRGVGTADGQPVGDITLKESSGDHDSFPTVDQEVTLSTPTNVQFAGKPTVKVNGSAVTVTLDSSVTAHFDVAGTDDRDQVVISNLELYVGSVSGSTLSMSVDDPADNTDILSVSVADVNEGLIVGVTNKNTSVDIGEDNQAVSTFTLTESTGTALETDDSFSVTCPDGVTFYEPPSISESTSNFSLDSNYGSLSSDRKTATWTVNDDRSTSTAAMTVTSSVNIASTVTSGTDIKFTFACDNSDVAVAPSPSKVAEASAGDDISITADTAPTISKTTNQQVGDITIKELINGLLAETTFTATIDTAGCELASTPQATPSGGLELKDSDGDGVTTAVAGVLSKPDGSTTDTATWTIATESSDENGGSIAINGIVINVGSSATTGAVRMTLNGAGMSKTITVGYISASANIEVVATGAPAIKINTADQAGGDIMITETKAGALAASDISLRILYVTTDNEIAFSEAPTISVVSGDIDVSTSGTLSKTTGEDDTFTFDVDAASGTKSVIKISGIQYDVSADAVEGSVQILVSGATRLATVSNAEISNTVNPDTGTGTNNTSTAASSGGGSSSSATTLTTPQDLKGSPGNGVINLIWSESKDSKFSEYHIYRVDGTGGSDKPSSSKPTATTKNAKYDDSSVKPGMYTYYVTTADGNGNESKPARVVVTYPAVEAQVTFSDIPVGVWYKDYVTTLISSNIAGGYPNGTFKPESMVSRAEFAKMTCLAMSWALEDPANPSFSDVPKTHWALKYIETMKKHGVIGGYPDGTFGPDKKITRAEIAVIVAKALVLSGENPSSIIDVDGSWAKSYIGACMRAGIVGGYPNFTFKPNNTANRAEAAKVIVGLFNAKK